MATQINDELTQYENTGSLDVFGQSYFIAYPSPKSVGNTSPQLAAFSSLVNQVNQRHHYPLWQSDVYMNSLPMKLTMIESRICICLWAGGSINIF